MLRLYQFVHEMGDHCFLTHAEKLVSPCNNLIPHTIIQPLRQADPATSALESNAYVSLYSEDGPEMHAGMERLSHAIKMFERN